MNPNNEALESLLQNRLQTATEGPGKLSEAMHWAVFPGGARIRPRLCQAVGKATGAPDALAVVPAAALELLHCASLVHDDLPCFDNAQIRRGKASVQAAFGERLAVLAGDGLIVMAFELLAGELNRHELLGPLTGVIARSVSTPHGIVAGQAWECEEQVDLKAYHREKTGALFAAATEAGAVAAGITDSGPWAVLGERLGVAYQVADDILDAAGRMEDVGKPVGQDSRFNRPNCVAQQGLCESIQTLQTLVQEAIDSIPDCPGRAALSRQIKAETANMLPARLAEIAA